MERRVAIRRRLMLLTVAVAAAGVLPPPPPALGAAAAAGAAEVVSENCTSYCGDIKIPYPFGVEAGCYMEAGFNLTCDRSQHPPKLFLGDGTVPVLEISIPNNTVRINSSFAYFPARNGVSSDHLGPKAITNGTWSGAIGEGGPYTLAWGWNKLFAVGFNVQVFVVGGEPRRTLGTCSAFSDWDPVEKTWTYPGMGDCTGITCCQGEIMTLGSWSPTTASVYYGFRALPMNGARGPRSEAMAWIAESKSYDFYNAAIKFYYAAVTESHQEALHAPAVLAWVINHTACHDDNSSSACRSSHSYCERETGGPNAHTCHCTDGYQGNPYIPDGCKDINECHHPEAYPCHGICSNIEGSFKCDCLPGYEGNASIPYGCKDINECAQPDRYPCNGICTNLNGTFDCQCNEGTYWDLKRGCIPIKSSISASKVGLGVGGGTSFLLLALGAPFILRKIKLHKAKKTKERFFKQNHGLLLQQLVSQRSDIGGRMIISLRELEKATNNFDPSHEIGGGGHGVVYKGLLDLQVVAIKKSKIIVQREIDDFINEVAILSQINHRNIVKLLGCCLETEVPLLVYEFISNGTLAYHLHVEGPISLSWNDRLRIALEISKALAYLHSAASTQILHRDIKSSNILLDDNLTAKVSDFGASRYIPVDQNGVTTAVQGTIGYLDPMCYYTGRLTDKSDVFSFGVLLVELLTRKKPFYRSEDGDSLVLHFASLHAKGSLVDILDPQIIEEEDGQVHEVAALAVKCTKLNGEDRPAMREVEMILENLKATKEHVHHDTTSRKKYVRDETSAHYMSFGGLAVEMSRQYTMEEEILLSARYPR